jgi:hypothetical protein
VYNFIAPSPRQNPGLEKKTPQAFRVRGLSNEPSSSIQSPAPAAVKYYQKGRAVVFHLSLDEESSEHDRGYA